MSKFKVGDVIRLKGGQLATVNKVTKHEAQGLTPSYECLWFIKTKLHEGFFTGDDLILVSEGEMKSLRRRIKYDGAQPYVEYFKES